jgi:hypothetical protein
MQCFLKPHVHAVAVDEDMVLLDVAADAYFCLPGAAAAWTGRDAASDRLLADLVTKGLATSTPLGAGRPPLPGLPTRDLRAGLRSSPTPTDLRRLAGATGDLAVHYRGRSFSHILAFAHRPGAERPPLGPEPELQRLCQVFATCVVWLPTPGKCLVRSFLLLRFLQRSGCDAQWVFGVRTWPFRAHCWVQADGAALEDAPERLCAYTPILAV